MIMRPKDETEVSQILSEFSKSDKKIRIIGTGNHDARLLPRYSEDILSTSEMTDFSIKDGIVEAQAGALVPKIREEASSQDLLLPLIYDGTVGGALAMNVMSSLSTGFGTPSNFADYVRAITPKGPISWKGFIGSKGVLGAISFAKMRTFKRPDHVYIYERTTPDPGYFMLYSFIIARNKPIAFVMEYEGGKYSVHASFTKKDIHAEGFSIDEGIPAVEESGGPSAVVEVPSLISDFRRIAEETNPAYAYAIYGYNYVFVYTSEIEQIADMGYKVFHRGYIHPAYLKVKRFIDFSNTII
ncbi:FAD-binding oxidoreductase [Sulfuracidifex metallicus]|uniref:FAD-binding protein n=1 Tax=Sulfuracidifex metallicus DSM 6482 = JCM 9184 TaxID=523847 RepID=A0A6A9QR35_SULME|nr:FAD-dependent oxidoreductase [Sulfuracidifex metallicus]MUN29651.1 FAD-binding protein [Sulfuracidifex metallicus DSM 6482 = JCM 9184]WOE49842.1 FAD-dependent oxidoreductase [Sulfuracidifex metallicus DSM 6482 = JCM 9184]